VNVIVLTLFALFMRSFLPSYMGKKGENLATKEDVAEITRKTEEVTTSFQRELAVFTNELSFTNDYSFNRYSILYTKIYGIIVQSEYLNWKYHLEKGGDGYPPHFNEMYFVNDTDTHDDEESAIMSFNKKELCQFIIENGEYASPELLKLSIAYRYVKKILEKTDREKYELYPSHEESEQRLIREIVKTVIIEYNELRKKVNLSFNEQELKTGVFDHTEFK